MKMQHHESLVDSEEQQPVRRSSTNRTTGPFIYLIAIGVSFAGIMAARLLSLAAVVFYFVSTAQDLFHHRQLSSQD